MKTINRADYIIQSQILFGDMLDRYDRGHFGQLKYPTQCKYRALIGKHIRPAFATIAMYDMTAKRIQDWLDTRDLAPMSRKDLRNILSGVFERATAWGIYKDANPLRSVRVRGGPQREKHKLTDEQTRAFLAALPYVLRIMCCTGLFCTLRVSEMLGLREKHLDFPRELIQVRQRFYRGDIDQTKSFKSTRDVAMGYLAEDLKRLCKGDPERFVFQIETAPQWGRKAAICRDDRSLLQHFLRPIAKELGFHWEGFGFHSLRREAVTSIGSVAGINQAMQAAGRSTMDMSLLYTLTDHAKQDQAVRSHQERILGCVAGRKN